MAVGRRSSPPWRATPGAPASPRWAGGSCSAPAPPCARPRASRAGRPTRCTSSSTARRAPSRFPTTSPRRWPPPRRRAPRGPGSRTASSASTPRRCSRPRSPRRASAGWAPSSRASGGRTIEAVRGDITTQRVDAIVNAANSVAARRRGRRRRDPRRRGAGPARGVPRAAPHHAARAASTSGTPSRPGRATCPAAGWCTRSARTGTAAQTDPALLASCFARSLEVARGLGARTIAFPAVSAGVYGWDVEEVAEVAVRTVRSECARARRHRPGAVRALRRPVAGPSGRARRPL